MFKHILISTDGSRVSNKAAGDSITLASALGAEVGMKSRSKRSLDRS